MYAKSMTSDLQDKGASKGALVLTSMRIQLGTHTVC